MYNLGVKYIYFTPFSMSKDLSVSRLCDVYGALLTEHRRELIRSYYDYDLSLAEIAENLGITRQAALCGIRQAETRLRAYETKLGVVANADKLSKELTGLLRELEAEGSAQAARVECLLGELR